MDDTLPSDERDHPGKDNHQGHHHTDGYSYRTPAPLLPSAPPLVERCEERGCLAGCLRRAAACRKVSEPSLG